MIGVISVVIFKTDDDDCVVPSEVVGDVFSDVSSFVLVVLSVFFSFVLRSDVDDDSPVDGAVFDPGVMVVNLPMKFVVAPNAIPTTSKEPIVAPTISFFLDFWWAPG